MLTSDIGIQACHMADSRQKLDRRPSPKGNPRRLCNLLLWTSLLLLFGFPGRSTTAAADIPRSGPVTSVGPGPQFAIADFDGDVRPDLASIQAGPNSSGATNYWIQLQFSAVGRQSIRLVAPAGGLRIEARDVNGDHAVDLILATAWFNQPVAVLLNNGHGSFSRAEPAAFPGAFSDSKIKWAPVSYQATEAVGVPSQSGAGIRPDPSCLPHGRSRARPISPSSAGFLVSPFLISHAGRAPPSEVPHN
jgi:hypothetical protein